MTKISLHKMSPFFSKAVDDISQTPIMNESEFHDDALNSSSPSGDFLLCEKVYLIKKDLQGNLILV